MLEPPRGAPSGRMSRMAEVPGRAAHRGDRRPPRARPSTARQSAADTHLRPTPTGSRPEKTVAIRVRGHPSKRQGHPGNGHRLSLVRHRGFAAYSAD
jgi:hypothetical protein